MKKYLLPIFLLIIVIYTSVNFLYKLDYKFFFTDEILYAQAGRELLKGDFTQNRQVPLIGKYIAGIAYDTFGHNVFFIRLPFAVLSVFSAILIFLIIKDQFDIKTAFVGVILYCSFPFIFETGRMTLLESPMHFFWLLSIFFFFRKKLIFAAIALGLAMAVKFTIIVTLPVFLLFLIKDGYKKMLLFVFVFSMTFFLTYFPMFIKEGYMSSIYLARSIKDTYLQRNIEGKNGEYSPQNLYLESIKSSYPSFLLVLIIFSILLVFVKPDKFSIFWLLNLVFIFIFYQMLTLKNDRYISTMEIPLIFLTASFIYYFKKIKIITLINFLTISFLVAFSINRISHLEPDKYNALFLYLNQNKVLDDKRILFTGSYRSLKWYFGDIDNKGLVIKKDFENIYEDLPFFEYIAIDKAEMSKNPDTTLKRFLGQNISYYRVVNVGGIDLFIRNEGELPPLRR